MTPSKKVIPDFLLRATQKYLKECFDQVKEEDDQDPRLYCNKHGRFPGLLNDKDSLILKKNRGLDKADIYAVQNGADMSQLRKILVVSLEF